MKRTESSGNTGVCSKNSVSCTCDKYLRQQGFLYICNYLLELVGI